MGKTYEDYINEPRAAKGPMTTGVIASEVKDSLPQEVKDKLAECMDKMRSGELDFPMITEISDDIIH